MKLKLLLAFIAISLIACSDNEDADNTPKEKKLERIATTYYYENSTQAYLSEELFFDDNNKPITANSYQISDNQASLSSQKLYAYSDKELLSKIEEYPHINEQGISNIPSYRSVIEYDDLDRVIQNYVYNYFSETPQIIESYVYNADKTISVTRVFDDAPTLYYTYYLNNNGQIYKRMFNAVNSVKEVTYDGDNIISETKPNGDVLTYTFDNVNLPKGEFHNAFKNMYSGNMVNAILLEGFEDVTKINSKYLIGQNSNVDSLNETYQYEFDEEGYPIKISRYRGVSTQPFEIRKIDYKPM